MTFCIQYRKIPLPLAHSKYYTHICSAESWLLNTSQGKRSICSMFIGLFLCPLKYGGCFYVSFFFLLGGRRLFSADIGAAFFFGWESTRLKSRHAPISYSVFFF